MTSTGCMGGVGVAVLGGLVLLISCAEPPSVPPEGLPDLYAHVAMNPELEHTDEDGCLRVHEIWKAQVRAVHETAGEPVRERVRALVEHAYNPFDQFWRGYLGDEREFRRWSARRFDLASDPRRRIPLRASPSELIEDVTARMNELTGRSACADWYVVYGPGWANLGGIGGVGMVVDFFGMPRTDGFENFRTYLPHEISHVIDGGSEGPSEGTLLGVIVGEGFASYVTTRFYGGEMSAAEALGYTEDEWAWALEHEEDLWNLVEDRLSTRNPDEIRPFRAAGTRPIKGGPGKVGYFLGYRIVQAYVDRHAPDSWLDLYDLDAAQILEESGYRE